MDTNEAYDEALNRMLGQLKNVAPESDTAAAIIKNVGHLASHRDVFTDAEPAPIAPTTRLGKFGAVCGRVLDNETTRTFVKAGGAFAGVALVAYSTIHKDHVMERQALQQANQSPS